MLKSLYVVGPSENPCSGRDETLPSMELTFNARLADGYTSQSQKIRVLTESWVDSVAFCPNCGQTNLSQFTNNRPVADFHCENCQEEYELKSKQGPIGAKVVDGAYRTMIERLTDSHNPNFFLLSYNLAALSVSDFCVIPKHFFVSDIIEKRKPLAATARRAGWVGCNILLSHIPVAGKIFFVQQQKVVPKDKVLTQWKKTLFLREEKELSTKGWLLDIMRSIEKLRKREFILSDLYTFESELQKLHPDNQHVRDKIRQQLQILRDKGYLDFIARGRYQLTD